jgi:hypothetical protein
VFAQTQSGTERPIKLKVRRFSFAFWAAFATVVAVGLFALFPSGRIICHVLRIDLEIATVRAAIWQYEAEFGAFPTGDSREVFRALRGDNYRQMVFIAFAKASASADGNLLDPWGTPYKVYYSGKDVLVRSAGPNKRFDEAHDKQFDDYVR